MTGEWVLLVLSIPLAAALLWFGWQVVQGAKD